MKTDIINLLKLWSKDLKEKRKALDDKGLSEEQRLKLEGSETELTNCIEELSAVVSYSPQL